MSPLEKVPFATFYPRWKYLCGTYFSKKKTFSSGLKCRRTITIPQETNPESLCSEFL